MTNISNLTKCSIDSLKIRIPLYLLDSYDKTIVRHTTQIITDTGEIEKEFKKSCKPYWFPHFKLEANIFKVNSVDCLILLVNSKQLGSLYFEGITLITIKSIYQLAIDSKIFSCSFNTFMKGQVTDADFKKDFKLPFDEYKEMINGMSIMTRTSSHRGNGKRVHKGKNNYGIEFNTRTGATLSSPFTKVYYKQKELETNSFDFSEHYLNGIDFKNVIRVETTVKDKQHFKNLIKDLKDTSLRTILSLTNKQKNVIMSDAFNRHLSPRKRSTIYNKEGLTPRDLFDLETLNILITENKYSFEDAIKRLLSTQKNRQASYRLRKHLTKLYNDFINQVNYTAKGENINSILTQIGWN